MYHLSLDVIGERYKLLKILFGKDVAEEVESRLKSGEHTDSWEYDGVCAITWEDINQKENEFWFKVGKIVEHIKSQG